MPGPTICGHLKVLHRLHMPLCQQLLPADCPLEPGKIHDSNRVMLLAALRDGGYRPVDLGIAADT